jgi:hypothetical protein
MPKPRQLDLAQRVAAGEIYRIAEICMASRHRAVRGLGHLVFNRGRNLVNGIAKPFKATPEQIRYMRNLEPLLARTRHRRPRKDEGGLPS